MFYFVQLHRNIDVHPKHFGKRLREHIVDTLISQTEGTCSGRYGYVIAVPSVDYIGPGIVRQDGTGYATFKVSYRAVVCRPYKGEVLDTIVTSVNKMGFFAEAGPLQIFVSNHLIPEDLSFDLQGDPSYTSSDGSMKIQEGTQVRLRIVGTKIDQQDIFCIGTIKEDYLGVLPEM